MKLTAKVEQFEPETIDEIRVRAKLSKIQVTPTGKDKIRISWNDTSKRTTTVTNQGGILQIEDKAPITFYSTQGFVDLKRENDIVIEIPEAFHGDLYLESADGTIRILGINGCNMITARNTLGGIDCSSVAAYSISLTTTGGKINARGIRANNKITLKSGNGEINCVCNDPADEYLYDIHTKSRMCKVTPAGSGAGPKIFQAESRTGAVYIQFKESI